MIVGAAFVPQTPLLVPEVAQGAAAELAELLDACRTALGRLAAAERWLILGSADRTVAFGAGAQGSLAGFGVDLQVTLAAGDGAGQLPASLTVGTWLLHDTLGDRRGTTALACGPAPAEPVPVVGATALLVVGDGSACRSEKAPGYLDERAAPFDAGVARALRSGEPRSLSVDGADEVLCAGAPAWAAAGRHLAPATYDAELLYDAAPYGVGYFVAVWTARG